jgi:SAM-dependent methyltransferase
MTALTEPADCPSCGPVPSTEWLNDGRATKYVKCSKCRTVYANPRLSESIRRINLTTHFAVTAEAKIDAERRRPTLKDEARLIQHHVSSGRMLDVGCWLGTFFEFFSSHRWQRYGVEISPVAAAHASECTGATVVAGTLQEARFEESSFDLVTMIDMFYYLPDPLAELEEVRRILKPGGILAVELSGQKYQFARSRGLLCWLLEGRWTRLDTRDHLFWPTPAGVDQLLKKAGFQSTWLPQVVSSPRSPNWLIQSLAQTHARISGQLTRRYPSALTLAPKYLVIVSR